MRATSVELATEEGYRREPLLNFFMTRYTEAYRREIGAFITAVEKGTPMSPSGGDGLRALLLADAAIASLREGRAMPVAA